jgi:hypothetical protein
MPGYSTTPGRQVRVANHIGPEPCAGIREDVKRRQGNVQASH